MPPNLRALVNFRKMVAKMIEPSIMQHIKQRNIRPNGSGFEFCDKMRNDESAGVQKKTNRYMLPSKIIVARLSARIRGSRASSAMR